MPAKFRRIDLVVACAVVVLAGAHVCPAGAITIYVNGTCGQNVWTGLDPVCAAPDGPKATIGAAIDAADTDDEIIVAQGSYYENIEFEGKQITLRSTDPDDPAVVATTIIDGGRSGPVITLHSNVGPETLLSGFTITNGLAGRGGGISGNRTKATITNCTITANVAEVDGGGTWLCNGDIINCSVTGNRAHRKGGGLFVGPGAVIGCIIAGNWCHLSAGGISGGRIIEDCIIRDNWAYHGGGIRAHVASISNCVVSGNSAHEGGGLSNCGGPIANCVITNNFAHFQGGGLASCYGTITHCVVLGNWSRDHGGGFSWCDTAQITNCIIWDNDAPVAAQLYRSSVPSYSCIQDWTGGGEGNIDFAPQFCLSQDYHLQPTSPCIDAGIDAGVYTDADGNARPIGPGFDMGCYEHNPASPCIAISPGESVIHGIDGQPNSQTVQLEVANCGPGALDWSLSTDADWLHFDPASGSSTGQTQTVEVWADLTALPHGHYTAALTISAPSAVNTPRTVHVQLNVNETFLVSADGTGDYLTIQGALDDAVVDGDTIIVAQGTYYEHISFDGKEIILRSTDPDDPAVVADTVIDGSSTGIVVDFEGTEGPETFLSGFTISNGNNGIKGDSNVGTEATISNCVVTRSSGVAVMYCNGTISNCTITDNVASDCALYRCNGLITGCTIARNLGVGLYRCDGTIVNCIIADNVGSGCHECSADIMYCTIAGNSSYAVFCYNHAGPTLTNSILWNNGPEPIRVLGSNDVSVSYCDIQGGREAIYVSSRAELIWGEGNIDSAPQFYLSQDYHLQPTSPCIDAGTDVNVYADADGNARPIGTGFDMGAFEFNPSAPSIALSPGELVFVAALGGPDPDAQQLSIANCGGGTLGWSVSDDADWLELDPTSGSSAGEVNTVAVTAGLTGLSHAQYDATITVSAPDAVNDPPSVSVRLCVTTTLHVNLDGSADYTSIQDAIDAAIDYDTIIVHPGTYYENIDFGGKSLILRGTDPDDPVVVAATIIDGSASETVVTLSGAEGPDTLLSGLTITNGRGSYGGGIYVGGRFMCTEASITNCVVIGNSSKYGGGGIARVGGAITACTISNNSAGFGGGLYGCRYISGCTIANNSAHYGGGLYGCFYISGCTIAYNYPDGLCEGGFWSGLQLILANSILWGNGPIQVCLYPGQPLQATISYSDIQGGRDGVYVQPGAGAVLIWGEGNINADPLFVDPDGPDDDPATWQDNDYHLRATSPCIDAGDNDAVPAELTTDLDGHPRFVDDWDMPDTGNGTPPIVDIGAYEFQFRSGLVLVQSLMQQVRSLELPSEVEDGLIAKLNAAARKLEDDNPKNDHAAANMLGAFINYCGDLRGVEIPEGDADALITAARRIIALLTG